MEAAVFDRRHALGNAHDSALREIMASYDVPRLLRAAYGPNGSDARVALVRRGFSAGASQHLAAEREGGIGGAANSQTAAAAFARRHHPPSLTYYTVANHGGCAYRFGGQTFGKNFPG